MSAKVDFVPAQFTGQMLDYLASRKAGTSQKLGWTK